MTEKTYGKLVQEMAPKSPCWKDYLNAFWIGGLICTLGQLALTGYQALGLDQAAAGDFRQAKQAILRLMQDPEARALLNKLGGGNGK